MKLAPLRSLVKKTRQIDPRKLGRDSFVYIDISSIDRNSKTITNPQVVKVDEAPSRARKEIQANDILVATVRPNLNGVAIVPSRFDCQIASTGFCVLRVDYALLDPLYLFYFVQTNIFVSRLTKLSIGAGYPAVSDDNILDSLIPLPSLPEQRRIAGILAKVDRLRRLRRTTRQLGETYLQSVFLEMFGDPRENPKAWKIVKLGDKMIFMTSGSRGWAEYYSNKGALFLRVQNLGANRLLLDDVAFVKPPNTVESRRTRVQSGDLLISATADIGRTGVIPENFPEAYINQHLFLIRLKEINPIFVAGFFSTPSGKEQILRLDREGVKSGLNFDDAKGLTVFSPPKTEQENFAAVVKRYERLRAQQREAERQAEMLFQSLLHRVYNDLL